MNTTTAYPIAEGRERWTKGAFALHTGEFRPPKKGEWYLSGAIVEAYKAPNDLTTSYHIARIIIPNTV